MSGLGDRRRRARWAWPGLLAGLILAVPGPAGSDVLAGSDASAGRQARSVGGPWSIGAFGPAPADCAATTLGRLSLPQKVGQLFMLGIGGTLQGGEAGLIRDAHIGSVTFSALVRDGRSAVSATTRAVQALATQEVTGRVRFLVAANQEGGYVQALGGSGFEVIPTARTQSTWDPSVLRTLAERWGRQLLRAGVNVDLAPVADVVPVSWVSRNAPIGRLHRELGHTPSVARTHVKAFTAGMRTAGVLTSVKHFPGLGRVVGNTDFTGSVKDRLTTRDDPFLSPFRAAIAGGVPFVMVSLAEYTRIDPGTIAAFSAPIMTRLLREDLGFTGVVMSDSLSAEAVDGVAPGRRAVRFLRAGGDLVIVTSLADTRAMVDAVLARARAKPGFAARVDASALRVLRAKDGLGLLPCSG